MITLEHSSVYNKH